MPENTQDLNYQPTASHYAYTPPKIPIYKKIFSPMLYLSTAFFVIFFIIFVVNYFNIISLSYLYPQIFGNFPHKYDVLANKSALSGVEYSNEVEGYKLEGKLYRTGGETVFIKYQGKIIEFYLKSKLKCERVIKKTSDNQEQAINEPAFCNDILVNKNSGKNVSITFYRINAGYNIINYISIVD